MDEKMMKALEADGEKLRAMTGEDHGPWRLKCTNGHDRCYLGTDDDCPYCERVPDVGVNVDDELHKILGDALKDTTRYDLLLQAADYIEDLVRARGNESSVHMWARGVELATRIRSALKTARQSSAQ